MTKVPQLKLLHKRGSDHHVIPNKTIWVHEYNIAMGIMTNLIYYYHIQETFNTNAEHINMLGQHAK